MLVASDEQVLWFSPHLAVPIGEPLNFTMIASGSRNITFSWAPPAYEKQFGVIILYNLSCESAKDGSIVVITFVSAQSNVMINLFRPDTSYTCSVSASNSIGPGPVAVRNATTLQDGELSCAGNCAVYVM